MRRQILLSSTMYHHAGRPPFHFAPNLPDAPDLLAVELVAACMLANGVAASIAYFGFLPPP